MPAFTMRRGQPFLKSRTKQLSVKNTSQSSLQHRHLVSIGPNTTTLLRINSKPKGMLRVNCSTNKPLKVMISGALGSGKGTQRELIVKNVPGGILIDRYVGRRLDPETGQIYYILKHYDHD
ncbi:hypothetical protein OIU84_010418 [Salix udensis]|uniref:Adenylate kinase n=1 Tax=Salix udensis TaxID=889485 RepID=A0AAD6JKM8_9ROSI|nr:hypothetical protein OIU84_010418 [Salix udensis]